MRRSGAPCIVWSCRGRRPASCSAEPIRSGGRLCRARCEDLLAGAQRDRHRLVYLDEAHIHQDADLGYGWSARGQRFWIASHSPRLAAKLSFYGLYLYNEGEVRLWPYARANGENTIDVLQRLRAEMPDRQADPALGRRALSPRPGGARGGRRLQIELVPLPSYSPDLMPVEALWRWLREDVTYHHCHRTAEDLTRRVAAFEARLNADPCTVADRLWVKDQLDPEEEELRFSK